MRSDYQSRRNGRIERLRAGIERAEKEGDRRLDAAMNAAAGMPLGQPILVGHHSEKRDRRFRSRIQAGFEKGMESKAKATALRQQLTGTLSNTAISSDNPNAQELLVGKIARAQFRLHQMEVANRLVAKPDANTANELTRLGFSKGETAFLLRGDETGRRGFPAHVMTRASREVQRYQERLESVKQEEARPTSEKVLNGVRIVDNREDNRVQIHLPQRADSKLEEMLRARGFRYSPTVDAWQRHRNDSARSAADDIAERLGPEKAHAPAEQKPWGWVEYKDRVILAGKVNGAWRELFDAWILDRSDADMAREMFDEMLEENRGHFPPVTETKFVTMGEYARMRLLTAEQAKPVTGTHSVMVVAAIKDGLWHELEKCGHSTNLARAKYSTRTPEENAAKEAAYKRETTEYLQDWVKSNQWWIDREGFSRVQVIEEAKVIELQREAAKKVEVSFEMNGRAYLTDSGTLEVLRSIVPPAKESGDMSAVMAVMELGQVGGRIHDMGPAENFGKGMRV